MRDIKKIVKKCLRPKHKVYVHGHTIIIHRKDALYSWGMVQLSMMLGTGNPKWTLSIYDTDEQYVWKVLLEGDKA